MATSKISRMRIVILGSTGQIGTFIHRKTVLDYPAAEVMACSRKKTDGHFRFDPFSDNWNSLGSVDVLINSVGIINETRSMSFEKVHVGLTKLILKNRLLLNNPRIIQISVNGADPESPSRFISTKAIADRHLLENENTVVIRPSIVCTPGTMIVNKFKMLKRMSMISAGYLPVPSQMLTTLIHPIMGTDLARIISLLCTNKISGAIEVAGPEQIQIGELMKKYLRIKPIPMNQKLADTVIPFITKLFPSIVNEDQYQLLKEDNVVLKNYAVELLKGNLTGTRSFWEKELS